MSLPILTNYQPHTHKRSIVLTHKGMNKPKSINITASFVASPLTGILPLTVNFIDNSTGSPTNWLWNFGDGTTSTVQGPVHIYNVAGIYNITLKVTNISGTNTLIKKKYIKVLSTINLPVASFNASPLFGAWPLVVKFVDTSTNSPNKWIYDFGDKIISNVQNPTHIYTFEGTYTVKLTVYNNKGCNSITKTEYITVLNRADIPVASFKANILRGFPPLKITFTDTSINAPTSWLWNFGDGTGSILQNPIHNYTKSGIYTVAFTAINNAGSDTTSKLNYINILFVQQIPIASFFANPLSGTAPIPINFVDTSTNTPKKWLWNFGDGIKSDVRFPIHTYSTSGSFDITLKVSNDAGSNTLVKSGYVNILPAVISPIASFFATPLTGTFPLTVDFTDASANAPTNWLWDFGDNTTSMVQNPSHIYNISGVYSVSLTVLNNAGSNVLTRPGYINVTSNNLIPHADFVASPLIVDIGTSVVFTDLSTNNPTSWSWDFGDDNTSILQNPTHSYSGLNTYYTVTLVASNTFGSDTLILNNYIYVTSDSVLQANFKGSPLIGPPGITISFFDLSGGNPVTWIWDFGDGGTSTIQNPTHLYSIGGLYTVSLTISDLINNNTFIINNYINITNVTLPVANFSATPLIGVTGFVVTFTDLSLGDPVIWLWNFGDGTSSNLQNPVKSFTSVGFYTISLTVTNSYGKNTFIKNNYINVTQF